jgi:hypothetical protein
LHGRVDREGDADTDKEGNPRELAVGVDRHQGAPVDVSVQVRVVAQLVHGERVGAEPATEQGGVVAGAEILQADFEVVFLAGEAGTGASLWRDAASAVGSRESEYASCRRSGPRLPRVAPVAERAI